MDKIYIAHRGNTDGPNPNRENDPTYIDEAINAGFDVEVDVWCFDNEIFLGHDDAVYEVTRDWIYEHAKYAWYHAKNHSALHCLLTMNYKKDNPVCNFFHNEDDYTLTSTGWIWAYPGKLGSLRTVAVMPENYMTEVTFFDAVCSDYVERYKDGKIVTI